MHVLPSGTEDVIVGYNVFSYPWRLRLEPIYTDQIWPPFDSKFSLQKIDFLMIISRDGARLNVTGAKI